MIDDKFALVILNPFARDGAAGKNWEYMATMLHKYDIPFLKIETFPDRRKTMDTIAQEVESGHYNIVIAIGGDGSLSDVINGMMLSGLEKKPMLGIIPAGTTNDIGKSFGIRTPNFSKRELKRCVKTIAKGKPYSLDLMLVNDDIYAADSFGIGFDPEVLYDRNKTRKEREFFTNGIGSYFPSLVDVAKKYVRPRGTILADNGKEQLQCPIFNLVVKGVRIYAGQFVLSDKIKADDGLLDAFVYRDFQSYFSEMLTDPLKRIMDPWIMDQVVQNSLQFHCRNIAVHLDREVITQVDGEEYVFDDHFTIKNIKHAIEILTPKGRQVDI